MYYKFPNEIWPQKENNWKVVFLLSAGLKISQVGKKGDCKGKRIETDAWLLIRAFVLMPLCSAKFTMGKGVNTRIPCVLESLRETEPDRQSRFTMGICSHMTTEADICQWYNSPGTKSSCVPGEEKTDTPPTEERK